MLRFDKATYLSFLFKCALSEKLNISLRFYNYISVYLLLLYVCIEFMILYYTFKVTSFP